MRRRKRRRRQRHFVERYAAAMGVDNDEGLANISVNEDAGTVARRIHDRDMGMDRTTAQAMSVFPAHPPNVYSTGWSTQLPQHFPLTHQPLHIHHQHHASDVLVYPLVSAGVTYPSPPPPAPHHWVSPPMRAAWYAEQPYFAWWSHSVPPAPPAPQPWMQYPPDHVNLAWHPNIPYSNVVPPPQSPLPPQLPPAPPPPAHLPIDEASVHVHAELAEPFATENLIGSFDSYDTRGFHRVDSRSLDRFSPPSSSSSLRSLPQHPDESEVHTSHEHIASSSTSFHRNRHHRHYHHYYPRSRQPIRNLDLPSFDADADNREESCAICLDMLQEGKVSAGLCKHVMHTACLKLWLCRDRFGACPVCRVPYGDDDWVVCADALGVASVAASSHSWSAPVQTVPVSVSVTL